MKSSAPTAADLQMTHRLRQDIGSFVRTGKVPSWKQYPQTTVALADAGEALEIAGDYHAGACSFWEGHGFFRFSWAGN
jgi:hypothetical protein